MKTLALIMPPDLREDGSLLLAQKETLRNLIREWKNQYRITLILRALRDKVYDDLPDDIDILYDDSHVDIDQQPHATYMQRGLSAWKVAPSLTGTWDCAIALDGLHPWCLATARYRLKAKRKIAYLPSEARLFVSEKDILTFAAVFSEYDAVLCASRWIQEDFSSLFPQIHSRLAQPPHTFSQANCRWPILWEDGYLRILTAEPLTTWRQAERIPALAAAVMKDFPNLQWYIFGEGPRQPYLIREIILNDVCKQVFPESTSNKICDLLPDCDAIIHFDDENEGVAALAQAWGVPVLSLRKTEGIETLIAWLRALCPANTPRQPVWKSKEIWAIMIEGENKDED